MTTETTLHREWSPAPTLLTAILWCAAGASAYAIIADTSQLPTVWMRGLISLSVAGFVAGIWVTLFGLTVLVQRTQIVLHLGRTRVVRTAIPFAEIASTRVVRYRPIVEFGGWGLRGSRRRRAWTARGDQAVELTLTDERLVLVGSDHPQRLEAAIRTHGGSGIARTTDKRC